MMRMLNDWAYDLQYSLDIFFFSSDAVIHILCILQENEPAEQP